ncbi:MAG: hypothetical protein AB1346_03645 [Thermodesulfobacteriota bacterium]
MKKFLLAALLFPAFYGCATSPDVTAWKMAREVNTPAAYEDYIRRYPKGDNVKEARALTEQAKTEQIRKAGSVAECVQAMKASSDPKIAAIAADSAFEAAKKEVTVEPLYSFLENFKGHPGAPEIRRRIEQIEFESAEKDASPSAIGYFLLRHPDSHLSARARELHAEKTYRQVKGWGSPYGYKAYLAMFPDSRYAAEIRGLVPMEAPQPQAAPTGTGTTLAAAVEKSPSLKRHACALELSQSIRKNPGGADSIRYKLLELEKGSSGAGLPEACSSVALRGRRGAEGALAEALQALSAAEEYRKELAGKWEASRQREEMVKTAIAASTSVANDLETAELSEEVLGAGPLGRLDTGGEKGSVSARKALERFQEAEKLVRANKEAIKGMLVETEALYRPLQLYAISSVEVR